MSVFADVGLVAPDLLCSWTSAELKIRNRPLVVERVRILADGAWERSMWLVNMAPSTTCRIRGSATDSRSSS